MKEQQPSTYVLTQDTGAIMGTFNKDLTPLSEGVDMYFDAISMSMISILDPELTTVTSYGEELINATLSEMVSASLSQDPEAICICLDRFLLNAFSEKEEYKNRFFKFSMCRTIDGQRVPRQKNPSFEEQFAAIKAAVPEVERKSIVIVDDGLFSGNTIKTFISIAEQNQMKLSVDKIFGFIGNSAITSFIETEVANTIENLYDWVDVRDFGIFGGKMLKVSKSRKVSSSIPYIFPWSEGENASLDMNPGFFDFSLEAIRALQKLIVLTESSLGRNLTFRDGVKNGFPLPTDQQNSIPISVNMGLTNYLERCVWLIEKEQAREVLIFDMDGTLYQLDGSNNGFEGSTLQSEVTKNAISFIVTQEGCTKDEAIKLYNKGLENPIGVSEFLAKRYNLPRSIYFDNVWDINPEDTAKNFEETYDVLLTIKRNRPDAKFILLTSAPRVWAENLLKHIGIFEFFEKRYTGEMYGTKEEVFKLLAARYNPERITSIGDQEVTDILPAQQLGMETLLITNPNDLKKLI